MLDPFVDVAKEDILQNGIQAKHLSSLNQRSDQLLFDHSSSSQTSYPLTPVRSIDSYDEACFVEIPISAGGGQREVMSLRSKGRHGFSLVEILFSYKKRLVIVRTSPLFLSSRPDVTSVIDR